MSTNLTSLEHTILYINKYFFPKGGSEAGMFKDRDIALSHNYKVIDFSQKSTSNKSSPTEEYFTEELIGGNFLDTAKIFKNMLNNADANRKISDLAKRFKPSLVHAHNVYHQFSPSIFKTIKKFNTPIILTLHDYKITCPKYLHYDGKGSCFLCAKKILPFPILTSGCETEVKKRVALFLETSFHRMQKSYDYVDQFVAPSDYIAELLAEQVNPAKITVIKNEFEPPKCLEEAHIPDDDFFLFCGRLEAEKGVKDLIEIFSLNRNKKLIILGEGSQFSLMNKLPSNVTYRGKVSPETVYAYMKKANAVLFPSLWPENASYAVLEALHFSKKVLVNNIGGMPEQIRNRKNGAIVDFSNFEEISELLSQLKNNNVSGKPPHSTPGNTYRSKLLSLYEQVING